VATQEPRFDESDLEGWKYLGLLQPMLKGLHSVGCERDKAGNRRLHYDQYCLLILLFLFNPIVRSLRGLQQASALKKVQRKLGCSRAALGSLSEAIDVFDPARLEGIIVELLGRVPKEGDVGRGHVQQALTAVDGSVVKTLCSLAEAAYLRDKNGRTHSAWRFHTHFAIDRSVPVKMEVSGAANGGKTDERQHLRRHLEADHCYVMDRWYAEYALWNEIVDHRSSYVCRIKDNSNLDQVIEERLLSPEALQADILRDIVVRMGRGKLPNHPIRVVCVKTTPHKKRGRAAGGTTGPTSDGILRIASNLLDVPAEVIADIYRHRWTIELFFRFFKHVLGCRHLLSTDPVGIQIQAYLAIIACLLIHLWTGGKPTLRTYEMVCFYLQGWADEEELMAHVKKLPQPR
jgi:hypothetical protein